MLMIYWRYTQSYCFNFHNGLIAPITLTCHDFNYNAGCSPPTQNASCVHRESWFPNTHRLMTVVTLAMLAATAEFYDKESLVSLFTVAPTILVSCFSLFLLLLSLFFVINTVFLGLEGLDSLIPSDASPPSGNTEAGVRSLPPPPCCCCCCCI